MEKEKRCERCGGVVPAASPGGECPRCLLEAGLGAGEEGGESPFDREELAALFPNLEIGEFVGRGGMGVVYRAVQRSLGRPVALKILSAQVAAQPAFAERFHREARTLARLNHPNIVGVHESGRAGDHYFLIMEYVDGINLRQAMGQGRLSPEEALAIVPQICDALQYAHDQGVVHRDVKPENILMDKAGRVKIADFGLAKLLENAPEGISLTREQQVMGTYHYIAPEQMRGSKDVDHRADIYSLGVVFYEMLTGEIPMGKFPPPSQRVQVDLRLDDVVFRALEQERERRYQQVSEFKTGVADTSRRRKRPDPPAAPAMAAGGVPLSKLAVTGIMGAPAGLLAVVVAYACGLRESLPLGGLFAGCALIGILFSGLGWSSIVNAGGRLGGLGLARFGTLWPLALGGPALLVLGGMALVQGNMYAAGVIVAGLGGFLTFLVYRTLFGPDTAPGGRSLVALGLLVLITLLGGLMAAAYLWAAPDPPQVMRIPDKPSTGHRAGMKAGDVHWLLARVDAESPGGWHGRAGLFHPTALGKFESLGALDYKRLKAEGRLGLAGLNLKRLPAPISHFSLDDWFVEGDKARARITYGEARITFPLARHNGRWLLDLGELEAELPQPAEDDR